MTRHAKKMSIQLILGKKKIEFCEIYICESGFSEIFCEINVYEESSQKIFCGINLCENGPNSQRLIPQKLIPQ